MASITYRMHRKNSSGSYDTLHLETESGVVIRPNGDTVEQTLAQCILAEDAGETVPSFTVDADTLGGSTKEEIIQEATSHIPAPYTHPTAKQCNYSYTHPTEKQCNYAYTHPSEKQCNYSYTHPSTIQCNASSEISSLKSSVSNGKALVANAITGKGVATSSSDTFATMANNISAIQTGNAHYLLLQADSGGALTIPPLGISPTYLVFWSLRGCHEAYVNSTTVIDFSTGRGVGYDSAYEGRNYLDIVRAVSVDRSESVEFTPELLNTTGCVLYDHPIGYYENSMTLVFYC